MYAQHRIISIVNRLNQDKYWFILAIIISHLVNFKSSYKFTESVCPLFYRDMSSFLAYCTLPF